MLGMSTARVQPHEMTHPSRHTNNYIGYRKRRRGWAMLLMPTACRTPFGNVPLCQSVTTLSCDASR